MSDIDARKCVFKRRIAEKLRSAVADATDCIKATRKQARMSGNAAGNADSLNCFTGKLDHQFWVYHSHTKGNTEITNYHHKHYVGDKKNGTNFKNMVGQPQTGEGAEPPGPSVEPRLVPTPRPNLGALWAGLDCWYRDGRRPKPIFGPSAGWCELFGCQPANSA